jgi:ABC-2 type transport system permease protein
MIQQIAKKEVKEMIREGRIKGLGIVLVVLVIASLLASYSYYRDVERQHREATIGQRALWENQGAKNPHGAAHYGVFAFKPVSPLSVIEKGLDQYLGVSFFLEAHRQNHAEYRAIEDSNVLARFGELSPGFVFVFLFPLLIIFLGFSAFTRERESGTLKLIMSQGLSLPRLLIGKILGIWTVLAYFLLPLFLLGLAFVLYASANPLEDLSRYGLIILFLLFYFAVFVNLSVCLSALCQRSNVALVSLIGLWIVSTMVAPKATSFVASALQPLPSLAEFNSKLQFDLANGVDGHDPYNKFSAEFREKILKEYGVEDVADLPFNFTGLMLQVGEEHEKVVYDKHFSELRDKHKAQLAVYRASSIVSPTILIRQVLMSMSRTDLEAYYHFANQAEDYRIQLMRELNKDIEVNASYGQVYIADASLFASNSQFEYDPISIAESLNAAQSAMGLLIIWVLGSFVLAWIAASRLKVV